MVLRIFSTLSSVVLVALLLMVPEAGAQVSFDQPSPSSIAACDDFATTEYGDPWDMSNTADVNNFVPGQDILAFTSYSLTGGTFNGVTENDNNTLYLFSPTIIGSHAAGSRFGAEHITDIRPYSRLAIRMYTDKADPFGFRMMWNRGRNYVGSRTVTNVSQLPLLVGWHTYTIDLNSIALTGDDLRAWSEGSINGFALRPTTQTGANIKIDWVRLERPESCDSISASVNLSFAPQGSDGLYSVYLDDDLNPFNGYLRQFSKASAAGTGTASTGAPAALPPGSYYFSAITSGDFSVLELTNPWDFSDAGDLKIAGGIDNMSWSGGALSGVTSSNYGSIYLNVSTGIDTSKYRYLSFKLSRNSSANDIQIFWTGGGAFITPAMHVGGGVYQLDLLTQGTGWSGTVTDLVVRPAGQPGVSFSLDWVSLRRQGYAADLSEATALTKRTSSSAITIDAPPSVQVFHPGPESGEALAAWNMNVGDFKVFSNLRGDADPAHPGENYTTWLPDVRTVDGLRGDFFKGTNTDGSDDPVNYSVFPSGPSSTPFDALTYKNLCYRLFIDREFTLTALDGSMARMVWKESGAPGYESSGAFVVTSDYWNATRWHKFCFDMTKLERDAVEGNSTWDGQIAELRLDPHEIRGSSTYYFDYIKLRKNAEARSGRFVIGYDAADSDGAAVVDLYYSATNDFLGGTLIAAGLSTANHFYTWDTTSVPNGTYYIFAIARDGISQGRSMSEGQVKVINTGETARPVPVLTVDSPQSGDIVCSNLQVKGFALQSDRLEGVAGVEVLADGTSLGVLHPDTYSPAAKTQYPSADSSNAGFDTLINAASWGEGAHTITIRAVSSDGGVSSLNIAVTKGSSGCTPARTDAPPAGAPITANLGGGGSTPPTPQPYTAPTLKASLSSKGALSVTVSGLSDTVGGCKVAIYGSTTSSNQKLIKSYTIKSSHRNGSMKLRALSFKPDRKKVKKVYLSAAKKCPTGTVFSSVKTMSVSKKATGKLSSFSKIKSFLAVKLKTMN